MDLGTISDIAISGLRAQRARLATGASNIANAETTRTAEGGPYARRDPVFRSERIGDAFADRLQSALRRVDVPRIEADGSDPIERYMPGHPDADETGMVAFPRVNVIEEMTRVMSAQRSYEANLAVMRKAEVEDVTRNFAVRQRFFVALGSFAAPPFQACIRNPLKPVRCRWQASRPGMK